jgi:hypothetical protein
LPVRGALGLDEDGDGDGDGGGTSCFFSASAPINDEYENDDDDGGGGGGEEEVAAWEGSGSALLDDADTAGPEGRGGLTAAEGGPPDPDPDPSLVLAVVVSDAGGAPDDAGGGVKLRAFFFLPAGGRGWRAALALALGCWCGCF